ncbi:hypothetical protein Tco_1353135, partial [Tanacetum coccineum]
VMDRHDDVVFMIHYNGVFKYDPLRYEQFRVVEACTTDRVMFSPLLDMLVAKLKNNIWALFLCILGLDIDSSGMKLIKNDANVHGLYDLTEKHVAELVVWAEDEANYPYFKSPPLKSRPWLGMDGATSDTIEETKPFHASLPAINHKVSVKACGFGFGSFCKCKKTVECVACLLRQWNRSRGRGLKEDSRCDRGEGQVFGNGLEREREPWKRLGSRSSRLRGVDMVPICMEKGQGFYTSIIQEVMGACRKVAVVVVVVYTMTVSCCSRNSAGNSVEVVVLVAVVVVVVVVIVLVVVVVVTQVVVLMPVSVLELEPEQLELELERILRGGSGGGKHDYSELLQIELYWNNDRDGGGGGGGGTVVVMVQKVSVKASGFGFGSFCKCKKTVECVACLLRQWNRSRRREVQTEIALDVAGEEVVGLGKGRDGNEHVQRMLHVICVINNKKGLKEDSRCDRGEGQVFGNGLEREREPWKRLGSRSSRLRG